MSVFSRTTTSMLVSSLQYSKIGLTHVSNNFMCCRTLSRSETSCFRIQKIAFIILSDRSFIACENTPDGLNKTPKYLYSPAIQCFQDCSGTLNF